MPLTTKQIIDNEYVELMCKVGKYLTPANHVIAVSAEWLAWFEGESICAEILESVDDSIRNVVIVMESVDEADFIIERFKADVDESGIRQQVKFIPQVESSAFEQFREHLKTCR